MELLRLASTVTQHNSHYEEAKKNATEKGSLNEVAIDATGRIKVYSRDTGTYEWIDLNEYDPELFRPVTNAELLNSRFNGFGGMAFDNETLTAVSDGVSLKSIQDKITAELDGLAANELSKTGYVTKQQREVLKGI
jgi:hypothetical protein